MIKYIPLFIFCFFFTFSIQPMERVATGTAKKAAAGREKETRASEDLREAIESKPAPEELAVEVRPTTQAEREAIIESPFKRAIREGNTKTLKRTIIQCVQRLHRKLKADILADNAANAHFFKKDEKLGTPQEVCAFYQRLLDPSNLNIGQSRSLLQKSEVKAGIKNEFVVVSNVCAEKLREHCIEVMDELIPCETKASSDACAWKGFQIAHCYVLPGTMLLVIVIYIYTAITAKSLEALTNIFLSGKGAPLYILIVMYLGVGLSKRLLNGSCFTPFGANYIENSHILNESLTAFADLRDYFQDTKVQKLSTGETTV